MFFLSGNCFNSYKYSSQAKLLFTALLFIMMATLILFGSHNQVFAQDNIANQADHNSTSIESVLSVRDDDFVAGDENAPVLMIEYASLSCPHCAKFSTEIYPSIKAKYIDTGKLRFVYRDFPHNAPAYYASVVSHCVPKSFYKRFVKGLFHTQDDWAFNANFMKSLQNIARIAGVSPEKFNSCIEDKDIEDKILKSRQEASQILGISGVPAFYIDGLPFEKSISEKNFDDAIAAALEKTQ